MRMNWFDSEVGPNEGWVSLTKQRWVNSGQRQRSGGDLGASLRNICVGWPAWGAFGSFHLDAFDYELAASLIGTKEIAPFALRAQSQPSPGKLGIR